MWYFFVTTLFFHCVHFVWPFLLFSIPNRSQHRCTKRNITTLCLLLFDAFTVWNFMFECYFSYFILVARNLQWQCNTVVFYLFIPYSFCSFRFSYLYKSIEFFWLWHGKIEFLLKTFIRTLVAMWCAVPTHNRKPINNY